MEVKDKTYALIYDIINATITTDGVYMKGKALSGTNQIRLSLRVRSGFGRNYTVNTETVNGVSFTATGVLTDTIQPIILQGTGTLTTSTTLLLELHTNTELSTPIYYAKIDPVMSGVRMLTLGDFSVGGANVGDTLSMVNAMLINAQNFGLESNSIVKVEPFVRNGTIINSDLGPGIISRATISNTELTNFATLTKPDYVDIIVICFRWFPTLDQSTLLANYTKNGGVLLVFGEDRLGFQALLQNIYGSQTSLSINRAHNPKGSVYKLGNFDDPILSGPFGNLKNAYWGKTGWGSEAEWLAANPNETSFTAYGDALIVNNFLAEDAIVYSSNFNYNSTDPTHTELPYSSTALRHREYPFLFVGDGGFTTGYPGSTAYDRFPFLTGTKTVRSITHANYPVARPEYGANDGVYRTNVYNSIFFANAIAWALSQTKPD